LANSKPPSLCACMSALVTGQISPLSTRLPGVKSEFANGISPAVRPIPSSCLGGGVCGGEVGEVGAGPAPVEAAQAVEATEPAEVAVLALVEAGQVAPRRPRVRVAQRRLDFAHLRLRALQGPRERVAQGVRFTIPRHFSHRYAIARAVSGCPAVLLRARRPRLEPSSWGQYTACTSSGQDGVLATAILLHRGMPCSSP
jgi:hypothetical protein